MGTKYKMTKAHDIFSGLGSSIPNQKDIPKDSNSNTEKEPSALSTIEEEPSAEPTAESDPAVMIEPPAGSSAAATSLGSAGSSRIQQRQQEKQIANEIARAESIVATLDGVKVKLSTKLLSTFIRFSYLMFRYFPCMVILMLCWTRLNSKGSST